ncbi:PEP-CTERM sorting domain-containing protein [Methylotenera sp. N17]|jgi:hypothetical protein|uniref:PEP-CTERM sorting domain-containing protein n=1 Tax=Methylotenera sp. N17 TaxID=1502761 RepID=UPI000648941B|nr:PEP-CTERM sorting domain-containing protein [Methylotenera sp. N17]
MKLKSIALAVALITSAASASAGNFVSLTDGVGGVLTTGNGGILNGANSPADRFYIETVSATYLAGYDPIVRDIDTFEYISGNAAGEVVATAINYRTYTGTNTTGTGTLTLLDWRVTTGVDLAPGSAQADIFDFVYRDSADNSLVFATRYLNVVNNNEEANYLYRYNASTGGVSPSVAWTFATDYDLRMYQAAQTSDYTYNGTVALDETAVRQKGDFSVSEGNPWSGLFFVKTNATNYALGDKAIGFFQAGEEGQSVVGGYIGGYVAVTAVPEPESYAMMLAGLGVMGAVARRRRKV